MKTTASPINEPLRNLQHRLERHFATCSALVGAAGALASAPQANADIVYWNPTDVQIPLNDASGIYFNLENGQFSQDVSEVDVWDINIFNAPSNQLWTLATDDGSQVGLVGYTQDGYRYASRLAKNTPINSESELLLGGYTTMSYGPDGPWAGNTSGYLGVTFQLANGDQVFGWIGVNIIDSQNARVTDWAYESDGGEILAGAVPEPGTFAVGFLAAGACGLTCWRRLKAVKAA